MLATLIVSCALLQGFSFQDAFNYPDASEGAPAWFAQTTDWEIRNGAMSHDGAERSFVLLNAAPHGQIATVEATLIANKRQGAQWAVAGVALRADDNNFWHLALIEAPADAQNRHSVELCEMLDGVWLAANQPATRLTSAVSENPGFNWEYGRAYRLRLTLVDGRIEGQVAEIDGTVRARMAYTLDNKAVRTGQPALDAGNMKCSFDDVAVTLEQPVPPVSAQPKVPAYPVAKRKSEVHVEPTGFFDTANIDGRWWLIDPNGDAFFAVTTDHVNYRVHWCETLGYAPYSRNVEAKYGDETKWGEATLQRLEDLGFNTLGCNHSASLRYQRFPHIEFLSMGTSFAATDDICPQTTWTGFPNVFSPKWARYCDKAAQRLCAQNKDNPWLIGYFIDNELEWLGKTWRPWGLFEESWKKPADSPVKDKWLQFVRAEVRTVEALEHDWGVRVECFDQLAAHTKPGTPLTENAKETARRWARIIAEEYFRTTSEAIRRHDPNHLVLGCRFAGDAPDIWDIAGRYCDVVSFNSYPRIDVERGVPEAVIEKYADWQREARKPMMLTEWSFPALDAGLPSQHGAGMRVDTQAQRAQCFRHFQETLFRLPFMVGSSYFMYADEPAQGISKTFPEDSNYGLVNVNDEPYKELTDAARAVNEKVYALHLRGDARPAAERQFIKAFKEIPPFAQPQDAKLALTAGALRLEGPVNGHAWRLYRGDTLLGDLYPLLHQDTDAAQWVAPNTAQLISVSEGGDIAVIDMEFAYTSHPDAKAATAGAETLPNGYRCGWRFWVPRKGGEWVGSQCLWVENTGTASWSLAEVFHYLMPAIGGGPDGDEPVAKAPNYYRPGAAWFDAKAGLGVGAWYLSDQAFSCYFYKDPNGQPHPDLRERVDLVLEPNQRHEMDSQPAVFFAFEGSPEQAFKQALEQVEKAVVEKP